MRGRAEETQYAYGQGGCQCSSRREDAFMSGRAHMLSGERTRKWTYLYSFRREGMWGQEGGTCQSSASGED